MKRIFKYVWKYKTLLIIPTLAMVLGIVFDMCNPYLAKVMIDRVIGKDETNLLTSLLLGIGLIALARAVFGYVKEYLFDSLSAKVSIDLKKDLFDHIQSLSFSYFDNMNTGELMSRISEDIDNIWRTISFGLRLFIENIIYFVVASSILLYLNWKLTIICMVTMPVIAFLAIKLEKKIGECYDKISDQAAIINTTAQENIAGVRLVKAFAREKYEILKFLELNKENYNLNMKQSKVMAKYYPEIEFLTNVSIVLIVSIGGVFVMRGSISIGTLVAFSGYIWMLIWPMRMLGWLSNMLAQNTASAKKIFKIMDTSAEIKDNDKPIHLNELKGHIQFKNVSFKYSNDIVLKDINFDAQPGETIAIMGTTGSGKTSIINLIGRYYDVSEGCILIDGINIKDLSLVDLRSNIAFVSQDTFLFSDTIEQNIKYGNENCTFKEIEQSCIDACADDFINELPDGYQTIIGERGIGLSGGQKQRLSIARALIKNSSVLVLDDSTSALDMDTEYKILKNIYNKNNATTTFIIAHRISAVKNADLILFLEDGQIVERGTHDELLKLGGKYYEIYCEQFKDFDNVEEVI